MWISLLSKLDNHLHVPNAYKTVLDRGVLRIKKSTTRRNQNAEMDVTEAAG